MNHFPILKRTLKALLFVESRLILGNVCLSYNKKRDKL